MISGIAERPSDTDSPIWGDPLSFKSLTSHRLMDTVKTIPQLITEYCCVAIILGLLQIMYKLFMEAL
jgi:hypothetical protein